MAVYQQEFICDLSVLRVQLKAGGLKSDDVDTVVQAMVESAAMISGHVTELEQEHRPCVKTNPDHRHREIYEAAILGIGLWFQILEQSEILTEEEIANTLKLSRLVSLEKKVNVPKNGASA
jgi:hypothetical protein